jgi:excisionase family DNA binding protein
VVTDDTWLTAAETARLFRVAPSTIYRQLRNGTCPFRNVHIGKSWRINADDVFAYLGTEQDDGDAA